MVQDVAKAGAEPPRRITQNTFNFKLSDDGARALSTTPHMTDEHFDVVLTNLATGESKVLDQYVTQPVHFLTKDGSKVAWVVAEKKTAGVYVGP